MLKNKNNPNNTVLTVQFTSPNANLFNFDISSHSLDLNHHIMATRKRAGSKRGASVEPERSQIAQVASKLPERPPEVSPPDMKDRLRFPVLVATSLLTSYLLYTFSSPFTSGDLATVSAHRDAFHEVAVFLAWRTVELGIGWYAEYDSELRVSPSLKARNSDQM